MSFRILSSHSSTCGSLFRFYSFDFFRIRMCGIRCSLCLTVDRQNNVDMLKRRGPNSSDSCEITCGNLSVIFLRFLLHIRGELATRQRVQNLEKDVFLYCGEVYNSDVDESTGDTMYFNRLLSTVGVPATVTSEQDPLS